MSFNQVHFPETYQAINDDIDQFDIIQKEVLDLMIQMLIGGDKVLQQSSEVTTLYHLLAKTRFNLDSAHQMIDNLKDDYRFKTSLNLLYRGILSDMISSLYLVTWYDTTQQDQPYLRVELDIAHMEFLKSVIQIVEAEKNYKDYSEVNTNYVTEIKSANPDLCDPTTGEWLTIPQMRAKTDGKFKIASEFTKPTETNKIEHINKVGLADGHQMFVAFKYLAQYQHFTPKMHDFLLNEASQELEYYEIVISLVLINCHYLSIVLNLNDKEQFQCELKEIARRYKLYKEGLYPPSNLAR